MCVINVCAYMPLNEYTHLSISLWSLLTDLNLEMPAPMPTGVKQVCECVTRARHKKSQLEIQENILDF